MNYNENHSNLEEEFQRYAELVNKQVGEDMTDNPLQILSAGRGIIDTVKFLNSYVDEIKDATKRGEFMRAIGELNYELGEVKSVLADKTMRIKELEAEIKELKNPDLQLSFDPRTKLYYRGNDTVNPFCTGCYDNNKKAIRLSNMPSAMNDLGRYKCPVCNAVYS